MILMAGTKKDLYCGNGAWESSSIVNMKYVNFSGYFSLYIKLDNPKQSYMWAWFLVNSMILMAGTIN